MILKEKKLGSPRPYSKGKVITFVYVNIAVSLQVKNTF